MAEARRERDIPYPAAIPAAEVGMQAFDQAPTAGPIPPSANPSPNPTQRSLGALRAAAATLGWAEVLEI